MLSRKMVRRQLQCEKPQGCGRGAYRKNMFTRQPSNRIRLHWGIFGGKSAVSPKKTQTQDPGSRPKTSETWGNNKNLGILRYFHACSCFFLVLEHGKNFEEMAFNRMIWWSNYSDRTPKGR